LILFAPVVITTIIFSFLVYGKYAVEGSASPTSFGNVVDVKDFMMKMAEDAAKRAAANVEVASFLMTANTILRMFALLAVAWFGSGLFAEDRRLGAHLLYFSRPLTRLDYFLGKFFTVATFAALACMLPGLFICLFAAWCSPNWSFLKEEGDVLWKSLAFSSLWIVVTASVVLAASSLVKRKTLALVGVFGFFIINHMLGAVLGEIDSKYRAISLLVDLERIGNWMFGIRNPWSTPFSVQTAFYVLGGATAFALLIVAGRLKKLEVVA
jgi:ABC-type transport system involved in multi-copper enzyme maturation permease subunit